MHRRQVLASVTALLPAAAGCAGSPFGSESAAGVAALPTASLSMAAVADADVAAKVTQDELPDDRRALLARVVDDGPVTVGWHQEPPLHAERPLLHDGTVYRVSQSVVDSRPAVNYGVKVDVPQRTPGEAETVQFADLPAVDRAVFEREGFAGGDVVGVGTVFTYALEQEDASVLVPEPEYHYVDWADGETAAWVVDDRWETEQHRYQYGVERAVPAGEYGAGIREEYAFELSGLSDGERAVVGTAIDDEHGYTVATDATPSPAFDSLADRFRPHEEVAVNDEPSPGLSGRYLVRYDGAVYWTLLRAPEARTESTGD